MLIGNARSIRRRGFTLLEVVTSVAIMAIVGAATIPTIVGKLKTSQASALVSELETLRTAIYTYKEDVGRYPDSLYFLSALPTTPRDGCGGGATNELSATQVSDYRGPYINRMVAQTDAHYVMYTGDTILNVFGTIAADSIRNGETLPLPRDAITIVVVGVDSMVANMVDQSIDGVTGTGTGSISLQQIGSKTVDTLRFKIPIYPEKC